MVKFSAYSAEDVYTVEMIEEIRNHARLRAVRIMPEIDSPSHTSAIGFYPEFKEMIKCG